MHTYSPWSQSNRSGFETAVLPGEGQGGQVGSQSNRSGFETGEAPGGSQAVLPSQSNRSGFETTDTRESLPLL